MDQLKFHIIHSSERETIKLIADWYCSEWNISKEKTIQKIQSFKRDKSQFQVVMTLNDIPVGTGGLYNHVGLLDKEPRFRLYKNWLALVYTVPEKRRQGFGAMLCRFIEHHAMEIGITEIFLFTSTAEQLYKRLGWLVIERLALGTRKIVVMKKNPQHVIIFYRDNNDDYLYAPHHS